MWQQSESISKKINSCKLNDPENTEIQRNTKGRSAIMAYGTFWVIN